MSTPDFQRPRPLRRGDRVHVIAPAGPFDRPTFERGLARLAARYSPVLDEGAWSKSRYLAGDDARRAAELHRAFHDPDARAVFCARGGYGAMRLLPSFTLPARPPLLVGFSDITALHGALNTQRFVSVHGPVVTQLGNQPEEVANALFDLLENPSARPQLKGEPLVAGQVRGRVLGGNLSVFTRLIGTPYLPPLDGAILFLEDVGERPYRLDRMWQHLKLAGLLSRVAGLAFGTFTGCEEKDSDHTSRDVLVDLARELKVPTVLELPVGHGAINYPLPLGAFATLDGAAGTLTFEEGAVW